MLDRLQPLLYLLLPLLLFGGLYYYQPQLPHFTSPWEELLPWLPYLIGGLVGWFGWHFNSGRSLLAVVIILLTGFCLRQSYDDFYPLLLLGLLPLNLAQIAWYRERGLLAQSSRIVTFGLAWYAASYGHCSGELSTRVGELGVGLRDN